MVLKHQLMQYFYMLILLRSKLKLLRIASRLFSESSFSELSMTEVPPINSLPRVTYN